MRYVTLPGTDLEVSRICLGTGALGSTVGRDESFAVLDAYVQAGGTFLDTAHVYADWLPGERHQSEQTIGRWLQANGPSRRPIIATKGGHPDLASMATPRLSPAEIVQDLDESLDCLGLAPIDLYWLHRDDPQRPVASILEVLNAQLRAGKIRYFGCSNWQPERIRAAHAFATAHGLQSFVASQIFWSLAVPNPGALASDLALMDAHAQAFYAHAGMGVLAYTSQARFFFSRAAVGGIASLPPALRRDFENAENRVRLARAQQLATDLGTTVAAIVLAYITSQAYVGIPIIGPKTVAHLHESLAAPDLVLTPEQLRYLTAQQR
jgi:aryl-alcohol dehydrogenase-like predicted oxidoreductase